ncbi:proline iminopeptidase-family hydrolase [Silvibacterium dinghuense]|uniref:Alpha/beta fold hydrolase n=1 Tax=Silvibacterium dinghuense TaxID=1560006 RepID=A0A4Q1S8M5_9BACT|nr:proline iminopeptidase-family hydrolase [Silvibacterium dinghuense]RXS93322.1 alpha/beta fold hydrolase [Silvibacterium dinghuense]
MRMRLFAALLVLLSPAACTVRAQAHRPAVSAVYPIGDGYIDAHGVMIYYQTIGRGAPLLVLHGGPGDSHDYFLPYLLPLARTNKLIFIDERGSGKSEKLADPHQYTVENMADDVEAVRIALGLGKISLLGHSYGGVLAQAYALKYQDHLSHLILASTFSSTKEMNQVLAKIKSQMPVNRQALATALEHAGLFGKGAPWERGRYPQAYATLAWGDGYFPKLYGARPDPNYDPGAQDTQIAWDVYREMWGSHGEFVIDGNLTSVEYVNRLATIKVPTLILAGDHDECDPSMSKEMNAKIKGSKLVILPNSGHMAFVDQPVLWNDAVAKFVNGK